MYFCLTNSCIQQQTQVKCTIKKKVNRLQIRIYKKKLTTTMDNKSLLNKNSLREDEFLLVLLCSDFISTIDNALEENCHPSCGNWLPVLKIWMSHIMFHKSITLFRNTHNMVCCLFYWSTCLTAQRVSSANPPLFATCSVPEQQIEPEYSEKYSLPQPVFRHTCSWLVSTLSAKLSSDAVEDGKQLLSFRAEMQVFSAHSAMEQNGIHTMEPITQYRCIKLRLYPIGFCYFLCNSSAL